MLILHKIRLLPESWRHRERVTDLNKVQSSITTWETKRRTVITELRALANQIRTSHHQRNMAEHRCAKANLIGNIIEVGGVLLAPFSAGFSLAATATSFAVGLGSEIVTRSAYAQHEQMIATIRHRVEMALKTDKSAVNDLQTMLDLRAYLEGQLGKLKIHDNLVYIQNGLLQGFQYSLELSDTTISCHALSNPIRNSVSGYHYTPAEINRASLFPSSSNIDETIGLARCVLELSKNSRSEHTVGCNHTQFARDATGDDIDKICPSTKDLSIKPVRFENQLELAKKSQDEVTNFNLQTRANVFINNAIRLRSRQFNIYCLEKSANTIPLAVDDVINTQNKLSTLSQDAQLIYAQADELERNLGKNRRYFQTRLEQFSSLRTALRNVYDIHHIQEVYSYLWLLHSRIGFPAPINYDMFFYFLFFLLFFIFL